MEAGSLGAVGPALDGVFDLTKDALADGGVAGLGCGSRRRGLGDVAREDDATADRAGDAVERGCEFGDGVRGSVWPAAAGSGGVVICWWILRAMSAPRSIMSWKMAR